MFKLSIITINRNNEAGLLKTISSVLKQTDKRFEYIVIDGGSTDSSKSIIEQNQAGIQQWISEPDKGIYNAMNKGVAFANGEYLLFLNSGDTLKDSSSITTLLSQSFSSDVVGCDLVQVDELQNEKIVRNPDTLTAVHLFESTVLHPCTLMKKSLFEKLGNYREDLKIVGDYEFFLRALLKHHASYQHVPLVLSVFDCTGISSNAANLEKHKAERNAVIQEYFPGLIADDLNALFRLTHSGPFLFYHWLQKFFVLRVPVNALVKLYAKFTANKIL